MRLLVSVRSAAEAEAALAGGADLIDVKEPLRGPLGRADDDVIRAVVDGVAGRRPVSAALGELHDAPNRLRLSGLTFVKFGLAGCAGFDWCEALSSLAGDLLPPTQLVAVAYADGERAGAPNVDDVVDFARQRPSGVLLIDTFDKARTAGRRLTLLDWLPPTRVTEICHHCRAAGVRVALAGSLGEAEIRRLLPARPDWFAVRGAACAGEDRGRTVSRARVRALVGLLRENGGSLTAIRAG